MKSVATAAEVTRVFQETKRVVSRGGFNLTKFVVNDKDLLEQTPAEFWHVNLI